MAGLGALAVIVITVPLSLLKHPAAPPEESGAQFVGSSECADCHKAEYEKWTDSDHDLAMDEATEATVLGDFDDAEFTNRGITSRFYRRDGKFFIRTEGPGGEMGEFEVTYTFGFDPLQQYLTPFPGGRLQALSLAWDTERGRWFHLYPDSDIPPDDWLHWTRNGQNWNGMCAECHSTNLKKSYDPESETYTTTWSEIDVGCEACHGPGSGHVAWAGIPPMARPALENAGLVVPTSGIDSEQLVELCAPCHSRRAELGDYDHSGLNLLDHMLPALLREGLYDADGQILDEVYVYGSFLQSKMHARNVRCGDCHDSHRLELLQEGNELCLQCHQREVYDSYDHHFHKQEHEGRPSEGALCVKCHMVEQPYMVVDWRADHSFRVPRPDLSAEIGTPNGCTQRGCHDDKPLAWSLDAYREWYGRARKPHFGTTFAAARTGTPGVEEELSRIVASTLQPAIVRATALELLSRIPGEVSAAAIEAGLMSDEPLLRHTAIMNAIVADPEERVSLLAPLLFDPRKAVRTAAVARLAGVPRELLKPYQQAAFDSVLEEFREAMSYSLDFASAGMNLGNLYANLDQAGEAERYYRLALKIDDLFLPARMNLAVLLSSEDRNPEAEQQLREALEAYPDNGEAASSLGLLLVEMGRPEEALGWLRRAGEADPRNGRVRYNLGLLLQQLGHTDEAEGALAGALELEPENLEYLYALTDHLVRRGRLQEALRLAERMIVAHPDNRMGEELKKIIEGEM